MRAAKAVLVMMAVSSASAGCITTAEPEELLLHNAQRRAELLRQYDDEKARAAEIARKRRAAEIEREQALTEIAALEKQAGALETRIAELDEEQRAAERSEVSESEMARRARETARAEHQRRIDEYAQEIEQLKKLLRRSAESGAPE